MPKLKDGQKVIAIQEAALKLVIKTGFAALKMADVARGASVATGTLYIYYSDKEALINDVYVGIKKEVAAVILNPANQGDTFYYSFKNMWYAYFDFCYHNPEKMLFVEQFLYSGYISNENIELTEAYFTPLDNFLEAAKQNGLIKDLEIAVLKAQTHGAIHEIVKVIIKNKKTFSESDTKQCLDMAWDAIRK